MDTVSTPTPRPTPKPTPTPAPIPGSIKFIKPAPGLTISRYVQIQVTAALPWKGRIEFWADGVRIAKGGSKYAAWTPGAKIPDGFHTIAAIMTNAKGTIIGTAAVQVRLQRAVH